TDAHGLQIAPIQPAATVEEGHPLTIQLEVTNLNSKPQPRGCPCAIGRAALVPARTGHLARTPWVNWPDHSTPAFSDLRPGQHYTINWYLPGRVTSTERLSSVTPGVVTDPPGRYVAIIEQEGFGQVRVDVTVTPAPKTPCGAATGAMNRRYLGHSAGYAQSLVEADGRIFRVVNEDGHRLSVTKDLRCNRIDATVVAGTVTSIDRY
ncbi:MAG TPA: hypothetical protein VGM93_14665, partial [Acidimicrobiales bacterium]